MLVRHGVAGVLAKMIVGVVRGYQIVLSPLLPPACRFSPSCSDYMLTAVRRFGALRGGWLGVRRIARCHPWGGCGFDPVPERFTGKSAKDTETGSQRNGCTKHTP